MTCVGSLSCQSFGPQPFQIFAQRDLLLLVFGQRAIRWTEYVVGVIFAFTHDVTLSNCRRWGYRKWPVHFPASPGPLPSIRPLRETRGRRTPTPRWPVAGLRSGNDLKAGHGEPTEPGQRVKAVALVDLHHFVDLADDEDVGGQGVVDAAYKDRHCSPKGLSGQRSRSQHRRVAGCAANRTSDYHL